MTGERDFTEADAARVAQFRNALDALRLYLPCIEDDYVRTAMVLSLIHI